MAVRHVWQHAVHQVGRWRTGPPVARDSGCTRAELVTRARGACADARDRGQPTDAGAGVAPRRRALHQPVSGVAVSMRSLIVCSCFVAALAPFIVGGRSPSDLAAPAAAAAPAPPVCDEAAPDALQELTLRELTPEQVVENLRPWIGWRVAVDKKPAGSTIARLVAVDADAITLDFDGPKKIPLAEIATVTRESRRQHLAK